LPSSLSASASTGSIASFPRGVFDAVPFDIVTLDLAGGSSEQAGKGAVRQPTGGSPKPVLTMRCKGYMEPIAALMFLILALPQGRCYQSFWVSNYLNVDSRKLGCIDHPTNAIVVASGHVMPSPTAAPNP
jgi:hypothetical protein